MQGTTKKGLFRGDILFVRRKRHARVRYVYFWSSHGVGRLFTYKVLVVISGQTGFALKIALKCLLSEVTKICYTLGNPG